MTEAEKLFTETFFRSWRLWAVVHAFWHNLRGGLGVAAVRLAESAGALYDSLTSDPEYMKLLQDPEGFAGSIPRDRFAEVRAGFVHGQTVASLDAAALVFAHSVLEGLTFDYLRVTALHAPKDWEVDLKETKVPLHEVSKLPYDEILDAKLNERICKLERESLLVKVDRLLARCQPPPTWSPMIGYGFQKAKLEALDQQRHEIVHGEALGNALTVFEMSQENLFYLMQTGMYFMGLINLKYGLQIVPDYLTYSSSLKKPDVVG
jgi:hypothetical protein